MNNNNLFVFCYVFKNIATIDGNDVKGLIYCLPQERLYTLLAMLQLCQMLLSNETITKMNSENLATCVAPNMMFDPLQIDIRIIQQEAEQCNRIFKFLIENFFSFKEVSTRYFMNFNIILMVVLFLGY